MRFLISNIKKIGKQILGFRNLQEKLEKLCYVSFQLSRNFCNFAKVAYFLGIFFLFSFHGWKKLSNLKVRKRLILALKCTWSTINCWWEGRISMFTVLDTNLRFTFRWSCSKDKRLRNAMHCCAKAKGYKLLDICKQLEKKSSNWMRILNLFPALSGFTIYML